MSQVFYRKWRPQRLDQVVGQTTVTQTLRNAVSLGRVAHAYLFCGPRGTGKTSTARIVAKAVNCLSPQDGEPDNRCEICLSINEGRALDLIEIDAASNRGIDDIKTLRDKVHYSPNEARYKVYIIDEVHMLTKQAFNALLKTLEEPPEHAIFVLATTEPQDVPLTIISRCQRFDFRRIPLAAVVGKLEELCDKEGIEAARGTLELIARASAGSLRDAENMLEQARVSYGSHLNEEHVGELLGLGSAERALELVGHVVGKSVREGLTLINEVAGQGIDLRQFHRGVMEHLRGVFLLKSGAEQAAGYPEETRTQMVSLAEQATLEHLVRALKTFSKADVRRDASSPLPLELALVETSLEPELQRAAASAMASPAASRHAAPSPPGGRAVPERYSGPEPGRRRTDAAPDVAAAGAGRDSAGDAAAASPQPTTPHASTDAPEELPTEPSARLERQWNDIVRALSRYKGKRFNLGALLRDCPVRDVSDGKITLRFAHRSHMERMQEEIEDPQASKMLKDTVSRAMDAPYDIELAIVDGEGNRRNRSASRSSHLVRAAMAKGARVVGEKEEQH